MSFELKAESIELESAMKNELLNTESIPRFEVEHVEELSAILFILFGYQNLFHFRTKTISYFLWVREIRA